jgi:hypothetical protein
MLLVVPLKERRFWREKCLLDKNFDLNGSRVISYLLGCIVYNIFFSSLLFFSPLPSGLSQILYRRAFDKRLSTPPIQGAPLPS